MQQGSNNHFETQWWSGTATAALCGRRTFPEAGLQSKQNFTLAGEKKNGTLPNITPPPPQSPSFPSLSSTASQPLAPRQQGTWGAAHNSAWLERAQKITDHVQLSFLDADWSWLSVGVSFIQLWFCVLSTTKHHSNRKHILPFWKKKEIWNSNL